MSLIPARNKHGFRASASPQTDLFHPGSEAARGEDAERALAESCYYWLWGGGGGGGGRPMRITGG